MFIIAEARAQPMARALRCSPNISNPQSESFNAIYYEWNNNSNKWKGVDTLAFVRIDSLGQFSLVHSLDPSLKHQNITILNDTLLLYDCCGDYGNTTISSYNTVSHSSKKLLDKSLITAVSSDHQYFACQRDNIASPSTIYQVKYGEILEKIKTPYHIHSAFGKNGFITEDRLSDYSIMRNDGSISDTLPIGVSSSIQRGKNESEILYITSGNTTSRTMSVLAYNFVRKETETLFSGLIFYEVFSIPNSDYYLLKGLSTKEWDDQIKERNAKERATHKEGGFGEADDTPLQPKGYWMIGDSETKKLRKLEYQDFYPIPSSSGRHILFYKQDSDGYQIKVISVKELVEGM